MLNTKCIAAAVNCALWHFFFNLLYLPSLIFFLYNFTFNSFNDDDKDFSIYFFKAAKKSILSVLFFVHEFSWKISRRHVKIAFVLSGRKYSFLTLFFCCFLNVDYLKEIFQDKSHAFNCYHDSFFIIFKHLKWIYAHIGIYYKTRVNCAFKDFIFWVKINNFYH